MPLYSKELQDDINITPQKKKINEDLIKTLIFQSNNIFKAKQLKN